MSVTNYKLHLKQYSVLSNGSDGGHRYIVSEIEYNGVLRRISILFNSKHIENKLIESFPIEVEGDLIDDVNEDLILANSKLI